MAPRYDDWTTEALETERERHEQIAAIAERELRQIREILSLRYYDAIVAKVGYLQFSERRSLYLQLQQAGVD